MSLTMTSSSILSSDVELRSCCCSFPGGGLLVLSNEGSAAPEVLVCIDNACKWGTIWLEPYIGRT